MLEFYTFIRLNSLYSVSIFTQKAVSIEIKIKRKQIFIMTNKCWMISSHDYHYIEYPFSWISDSIVTPKNTLFQATIQAKKKSFIGRNSSTFINIFCFWFELAIAVLRDQEPGTFLVRDSTSFPGAFGLALKVGSSGGGKKGDPTESVRHFLIETTTSGVRIKGCQNEPVFGQYNSHSSGLIFYLFNFWNELKVPRRNLSHETV